MNITEACVLVLYLSGCYAITYACYYPEKYFQMVDDLWNNISNQYLVPHVIKFVKMYSSFKNDIHQLKQNIYLYHPMCTNIFDLYAHSCINEMITFVRNLDAKTMNSDF